METKEFKQIKSEWREGKISFKEFLEKWEKLRNIKPPKQKELFKMRSPEKAKQNKAYKY